MNDGSPEESQLFTAFIDRFFIPCPGPFEAWLLYSVRTGRGMALAVGNLKPGKRLRKGKLPLGAVSIDPKFQDVLLSYGPEALWWNGREIVVAVGVN